MGISAIETNKLGLAWCEELGIDVKEQHVTAVDLLAIPDDLLHVRVTFLVKGGQLKRVAEKVDV